MTMTIDQNSEAVKTMMRLRDRARDLRPVFHQAADHARIALTQHFDTEGRGAWQGLATSTVRMRGRRQGYYGRRASGEGASRRVLHWSLRLRRSLTQKGHRFHISRAPSNRTFVFGSRDQKAAIHQEANRGGKLPRRIVMPKGAMYVIFFRETAKFFREIIAGRAV
jgi:phage gpG-like protein